MVLEDGLFRNNSRLFRVNAGGNALTRLRGNVFRDDANTIRELHLSNNKLNLQDVDLEGLTGIRLINLTGTTLFITFS